ncbi:MAG: hypothetical protein GY777_29870 [Candidatus Brocadiaceae bacterium]|nr:hypothetical protein [Candidatus Brocadiaceae bacterium]
MLKFKVFGIVVALLFITSAAMAACVPQPNVYDNGNRWRVTFYNDSATGHDQWGSQIICFSPYTTVGTSIQGHWYALTFPDWNGRYYQEGDELKMTGDYAKDIGHDHLIFKHTTEDRYKKGVAFGDWTEWREDSKFGNIIGWGNATLERVGSCKCDCEIDKVAEISKYLPPRLTLRGIEAQSPGEKGLESVEDYLSRTGIDIGLEEVK